MAKLSSACITGFKSINEMELHFGPLNVLIGANGAGKSNLISFFKMLSFAVTGALQKFVGTAGGANSLLHYGAKTTSQITASLVFTTDRGENTYAIRLAHAGADTLIFVEERVRFQPYGGRP